MTDHITHKASRRDPMRTNMQLGEEALRQVRRNNQLTMLPLYLAYLCLLPRVASSDPARERPPGPRLQLDWQAPAGCPDASHVRDRIAARLARAPFAADAPVVVVARVRTDGNNFELTLDVHAGDDDAHREWAARECEALARAAVLATSVIAQGIETTDPPARSERSERSERSSIPANSDSQRATGESAADEAVRPAEPAAYAPGPATLPAGTDPNVAFALGVWAGASIAILPGIAATVGGDAGAEGRHWRLSLGVAHHVRQRETFATDPNAGADLSAWIGTATACGIPRIRRLRFPLCGSLKIGSLRGRGFGADIEYTRTQSWAALGASVGLMVAPTPWIELGGRASIDASLRRPAFSGGARGELHRLGSVSGSLTAVVGFSLSRHAAQ